MKGRRDGVPFFLCAEGFHVRVALVEWGPGQDLEMMVEVWNTAALLEAVLEALLEDPQAMTKAMGLFRPTR